MPLSVNRLDREVTSGARMYKMEKRKRDSATGTHSLPQVLFEGQTTMTVCPLRDCCTTSGPVRLWMAVDYPCMDSLDYDSLI